jgi:IS5 family transposase
MHQTKKGNQWHFAMNVHLGADRESGLIHSLETTAANGHDLTPAADLLHGEETVVDADAGHQGIEKRPEMQGRGIGFQTAMRPHPFRVIKQQFDFQKTQLRGMLKNHSKVNGLAALSNLFMA